MKLMVQKNKLKLNPKKFVSRGSVSGTKLSILQIMTTSRPILII